MRIIRSGYLEKIAKFSSTGQIISIIGVRRSGKSTLMRQYIKTKIEKGENRRNFLFINLEEPQFTGELSVDFLQSAYEAYLEIVKPLSKPTVILDEVQNVKGWERFARALQEKDEANVIVSGSSAKLLGRELGTVLTGRHIDLIVYPLSFREFLFFNKLVLEDQLSILSQSQKIRQLLHEYLSFGGFPKIVFSSEKKELLMNYFDDIIIRDAAVRHNIVKIDKLKTLATYYLSSISSPCSFNKIAKFLGINLDTVERFSAFLSETYLLFFIKKFSYSLKEQEVNPRKVYAVDLGLRNIVAFKITKDMGKLFENAVFFELLRKGKEIYYYKKNRECDFIIKENDKISMAIQVCVELTEENKKREYEGLVEAMDQYNLKEGFIINEKEEQIEKIKGKKIHIIPLWKWLLF